MTQSVFKATWPIVFGTVVAVAASAQTLSERILAAEDARVIDRADLAPILTGLRETDPRVVAQAVRARFERPALVRHILPLVTHVRPEVRAEALNALGQALAAVPTGPDAKTPPPPELSIVSRTVITRLGQESDRYVADVAAETLGRLPFRTAAAVTEAETALAAQLAGVDERVALRAGREPSTDIVHPGALTGTAKGLETLIRVHQKLQPVSSSTLARLRVMAMFGSSTSDEFLAYLRRVSWLALTAARAADETLVERGLQDPDPQVRRLAVLALPAIEGPAPRQAVLLARAFADPSFMVRFDAVRAYSRTRQKIGCTPLVAAVDDANMHVGLAAIDALGSGCPPAEARRAKAGPSAVARLLELVEALPAAGTSTWHKPAHALVSLARVSREQAIGRMASFAEHPAWQVRMYAARAAAVLGAEAGSWLDRLALDGDDNVRDVAVTGLPQVRAHEADSVYIDALARTDYQLLRTAALALEGSPRREQAVPALIAAFSRVTAEHRDTSRDARMAILARLRELGSRVDAPALKSCLADFDPVIAAECVATLGVWTGNAAAHMPAPARARPPVPVDVPAATHVTVTMQRGGTFEVRLFRDEAPASVARFVRLASRGYYNGLTFHRVAPNFVIQGGSPGANEYAGDGPFMRDELGLRSHRRGTLGISTRGRDTGDAQIFINLVDNPRLDHNFTVFAEVSAGMAVVEGILEGDVIERVDVLAATATESRR
jgi:cyclophilin family peptidyl-prolyl cis-trans isomerase/HEAT repeat protein